MPAKDTQANELIGAINNLASAISKGGLGVGGNNLSNIAAGAVVAKSLITPSQSYDDMADKPRKTTRGDQLLSELQRLDPFNSGGGEYDDKYNKEYEQHVQNAKNIQNNNHVVPPATTSGIGSLAKIAAGAYAAKQGMNVVAGYLAPGESSVSGNLESHNREMTAGLNDAFTLRNATDQAVHGGLVGWGKDFISRNIGMATDTDNVGASVKSGAKFGSWLLEKQKVAGPNKGVK